MQDAGHRTAGKTDSMENMALKDFGNMNDTEGRENMDGLQIARREGGPGGRTIAAISTAQAPGGIGVIRISGPRALETADRVFFSAGGKKISGQKGYTVLYGEVRELSSGEKLDEALATCFRAPRSFTGEDVAELSCHGGLYILRRVLKEVYAAGASPAEPGEFTRRAFLNGKIGLTEAESVMELISAQGAGAARAAMAGHEGVLEKRIRSLRERLVGLAAHLDAWADYPEEDIEEVTGDALERSLAEASEEIGRLLSSFETGKILREGVDTVIAGRPNAGKSTLMNLLSGCERSIVTDVAGTTRDIVEETVLLGDIPLRLADTAGLRFTEDPVESIGVEKARQRLASAGLILAVFDSSCELNEEDRELINACRGVPSVAVINKSDLESKMDYSYIRESFRHSVVISALSGDGLAELSREVTDLLRTGALDPDEGILFTERQRDAARRAGEGVEEARQALRMGMTLDAVTVSLEGAVSALLELTGERASEAVVEQVFAHFCVGK